MTGPAQEVHGPGADDLEEPNPRPMGPEPEKPKTALQRSGGAYDLVAMAVDKDLDIEKLKVLHEMYKEERAAEAERAFVAALVAFQAECPPITKGKLVDYTTKDGQKVRYRHAELHHILRVIRSLLAKHAFSYSWSRVKMEGEMLAVCTLSHSAGHSRTASFPCPVDDRNTKMSEQQRSAAATTFAERYTLVLVLGLVTADPDTDGMGPEDAEKITEQEAMQVITLAQTVGVKIARVLKAERVEKAQDIPKAHLASILAKLETHRAAPPAASGAGPAAEAAK